MTDQRSVLRLSFSCHMSLRNARPNVPGDSWNLSPPPGFEGLHPDRHVTRYVRHLPHWRQDGATYFVTFRLADSLPQEKLRELKRIKEDWERKHPPPRGDSDWQALSRETIERVENWLDQGLGSCVLAEESVAAEIVESMHYFDDERYELDCHVVMANHVHLGSSRFNRCDIRWKEYCRVGRPTRRVRFT